MARGWCRSNKDFHVTLSSGCQKERPHPEGGPTGRLKQTGWRICVTPRLRGGRKRLRLQCVMAMRRRKHGKPIEQKLTHRRYSQACGEARLCICVQDRTTTRSAGRASSRYEANATREHSAIRAVMESAECWS